MSRWFVRICAVLIVLRSFTNFGKLLQGEEAVLVFFGQILRGSDTTVLAVLVGLFMLVTGVTMLLESRWALALMAAYASYVAVNLLAWTLLHPEELVRVGSMLSGSTDVARQRQVGIAGFIGYGIVALGTTALPAWILYAQRSKARGR